MGNGSDRIAILNRMVREDLSHVRRLAKGEVMSDVDR